MSDLLIAVLALMWVILALLSFAVMGLLRQFGLLQMRLGLEPGALITGDGLERGMQAPGFETLELQSAQRWRLEDFRGHQVLLVFLTTSCDACQKVVPHINSVAYARRHGLRIAAVCSGAEAPCREFATRNGLRVPTLLDPDSRISGLFRVTSTPSGCLINEMGTVLIHGIVNSWPQIEALLDQRGTVSTAGPGRDDDARGAAQDVGALHTAVYFPARSGGEDDR